MADEQGHRTGLSVTTLTAMSTDTPAPPDQQVRMGRLGPFFAGVWLFFLVSPLLEGWAHRDELSGVLGIVVTLRSLRRTWPSGSAPAPIGRSWSTTRRWVGRSPTSPCSWSSAC